MHFTTITTILAITGAALAQDLSQVPKCAVTPALAAFGKTGCPISNVKCICQSTNLVADLEAAIAAACTPAELAVANAFAVNSCAKAGVTLVIPGYTTSGSASATGTGSSATGSASTASTTATGAGASASGTASSVSSAISSALSTQMSSSSSGSPTSSAGQTSSSASATPSPGAGNTLQVGGSALFGALLAALAL